MATKTAKIKSVGLLRKKNNFARCSTISFLVHFFVVVLHDYNVKLPETS